MPSNADRRRQEFFRQVRGALARADDGDLDGVRDVIRQVRRWVSQPVRKSLDVRLGWSTWTDGRLADDSQGSVRPFPALLAAPSVPVDLKDELIALTGQIRARQPWLPLNDHRDHLDRLGPDLWLRSSNVPAVAALVREQRLEQRWRSHLTADRPPHTPWAQALTAWILDEPTWNGQTAWTMAHRRTLFIHALMNGWWPVDVLDTWNLTAADMTGPASHRAVHRMHLHGGETQPGFLVDLLTATEAPGGLLESWRAQHPHDWSTRVSPASGTTVWSGLLHNPNPALLDAWIRDDPGALDRPVPVGRWNSAVYPNDAADPLRFRTVAGRTSSRGDLKVACERAGPDAQARLDAWWNDPAPTLRTTLDVWLNDLLPMNDSPHPHHDAWHALGQTIVRQDLLAVLDLDAGPESRPAAPPSRRL